MLFHNSLILLSSIQMARVLKALQGKRNVRNRMESSYKLLVERGRSGSHQAFGKVSLFNIQIIRGAICKTPACIVAESRLAQAGKRSD